MKGTWIRLPRLRDWPTRVFALVGVVLLAAPTSSLAGAFIFASEANGVDIVTHPTGYTGSGGTLSVSVCIDPSSANAADMEIPVRNIVHRWNERVPVTGNLLLGGSNDIPASAVDFESVALHELGHCIGAAHPNLASESGLGDPLANATRSTDGADDAFDPGNGTDGIYGSSDDARDDDVNLHWFRTSNNNPFTIDATVDSSSYSRDLADLPAGQAYAANADRSVGSLLGVPNTEAVMQQGTFADEDQRRLAHDDVATVLYGMSGLDETAGNSDDYSLSLSYVGLTTGCDIVLDFDNTETGFAVCKTSGSFVATDHLRITSADIFFNTAFTWHFNDTLTAPLAVTFEEVETGTASNSATVSTSAVLSGVADQLYLASVSYRPDTSVSSVSGLGLSWSLVSEQCAGAASTEVSVWQALGTPTGDEAVTATLSSSISRSVIAVTRYSGVRGLAPVAGVVSGNTNGIGGACSGGSNSASYSFNVATVASGSRVYGAVAKRQRSHTPGPGFAERAEVQSGSGSTAAGVAVEDREVASPGSLTVDGSFTLSTDWAFVGLEIVAAECSVDADCDDALFCNGTETCSAGSCVAGTTVDCDDAVTCTADACNEGTDQCDNTPMDALCDDTLFCNGVETCDVVNDCQAGTTVDCDDAVTCTADACNEGTDQCDNTPMDALCDDTLFCNGVETCDVVNDCQAGTTVDCDDAVTCTADACNEGTDQCDNTPMDVLCDDTLFCNGVETCDVVNDCQAGATVDCDDAVTCTVDVCNESTDQCDNATDDAQCKDGIRCTEDVCDAILDCQNPPILECVAPVPASTDWTRLLIVSLILLSASSMLTGALPRRAKGTRG